MNAYNTILKKYPLTVTSLTTGVCYGLGDVLAQKVEKNLGRRDKYDLHRMAMFTVFGTVFGGPVYYAWFSKLDKVPKLLERIVRWNQSKHLSKYFHKQIFQQKNFDHNKFFIDNKQSFTLLQIDPVIKSKTILTSKVLADQLIFSSLYPLYFIFITGVLVNNTGKEDLEYILKNKCLNTIKINTSLNDSWKVIKNKYIEIYKTDCAVWPMIQMINFTFVSAHLQPIFVNSINI